MISVEKIAEWMRYCVEHMSREDNDATYRHVLDDDLCIYIGWGDGFDESDEYFIHSKSNPNYCVCVKIAENNPYCWLWDNVYMPWDAETEEVYDTDTSISPNEDYKSTAEWLVSEYRTIREKLDNGELTFGV